MENRRIREYVKRTSPEPQVLRLMGEVSERNGTDKMTSRKIDEIIRTARTEKRARNKKR